MLRPYSAAEGLSLCRGGRPAIAAGEDAEGGGRSRRRVVVEQEVVGVGGGIESKAIESGLESLLVVDGVTATQGHQRGHEDLAGAGAGIGLRAEAHLAGDDERAGVAFGEGGFR